MGSYGGHTICECMNNVQGPQAIRQPAPFIHGDSADATVCGGGFLKPRFGATSSKTQPL